MRSSSIEKKISFFILYVEIKFFLTKLLLKMSLICKDLDILNILEWNQALKNHIKW
jgi:hypothetical protein